MTWYFLTLAAAALGAFNLYVGLMPGATMPLLNLSIGAALLAQCAIGIIICARSP